MIITMKNNDKALLTANDICTYLIISIEVAYAKVGNNIKPFDNTSDKADFNNPSFLQENEGKKDYEKLINLVIAEIASTNGIRYTYNRDISQMTITIHQLTYW